MAQETEAACLLKTGAMYARRAGLLPPGGDLAFLGVKRGAFSLYEGDEPIYHFDLEGRWQRAYIRGTHFRRSLDGSINAIDRVREGASLVLNRRRLDRAEGAELDESIRRVALDWLARLPAVEVRTPPPGITPVDSDQARELLERVARWDTAAWDAHRERYAETYGALPFLPPDDHQAVILQATLGHAGGVAFGGGAADDLYVRTEDEFADHCGAVAALLGRRLAQNRNVFLAGSYVARLPFRRVEALFGTIARAFPIAPDARRPRDLPEDAVHLSGIDLFLDDLSPGLPDRAGWSRLKELGLGRLNLGIESGSHDVRARYGKRWWNDDLRTLLAETKAAVVPLGLVFLIGAGGRELADLHLRETMDLLTSLNLGPGDLVYLVDAAELDGPGPGMTALAVEERDAQTVALKECLAPLRRLGAKVVPYSTQKEWN